MNYPHPLLAREGWPFIAASTLVSIGAWIFFGLGVSVPFWIITLFVVQFFRDPAREVPEIENAVLSPADGRIVKVERCLDPYAGREALLISVFMNVFNVHSNRASATGKIVHQEYFSQSWTRRITLIHIGRTNSAPKSIICRNNFSYCRGTCHVDGFLDEAHRTIFEN